MKRFQEVALAADLEKKMVFLSGPRQVGKTTLCRNLAGRFSKADYFNHDSGDDRLTIHRREWNRKADLVVLDEIHKHRKWKTLLKGVYDTEGIPPRILVTGSARLDVYRRGGDSLAGRYFRHRLLPLSLGELLPNRRDAPETLQTLMKLGGFPEPFLGQSESNARRWRKTHLERIVREDVQDLEPVQEIQSLLLMVDLLRSQVGGLVSYASLARDLQISPHTVKRWIEVLEQMYVLFRVTPWRTKVARSLLKTPKIYFYDTGLIRGDDGARLENTVAVSLLKMLWYLEDTDGRDVALHYLRDKEGREVDFATVVDGELRRLIEVKTSGNRPTAALTHFSGKLGVESTQAVLHLKRELTVSGISITPAAAVLSEFPI